MKEQNELLELYRWIEPLDKEGNYLLWKLKAKMDKLKEQNNILMNESIKCTAINEDLKKQILSMKEIAKWFYNRAMKDLHVAAYAVDDFERAWQEWAYAPTKKERQQKKGEKRG